MSMECKTMLALDKRIASYPGCPKYEHVSGEVKVKNDLREEHMPMTALNKMGSSKLNGPSTSSNYDTSKGPPPLKTTATKNKVSGTIVGISSKRMDKHDAEVQLERHGEPQSARSLLDSHVSLDSFECMSKVPPHFKQMAVQGSDTSSRQMLVEQMMNTLDALEETLSVDHQYDFKLRVALAEQTELVRKLQMSLEDEKLRNERLVKLLSGLDNSSSTEDDVEDLLYPHSWQGRASFNAFDSISPLLMQQRYEELSESHSQCRRQLSKKEHQLLQVQCENEALKTKFETLKELYTNTTQRCEKVCLCFLRLRARKHHEIQLLKHAVINASECIRMARQTIASNDPEPLNQIFIRRCQYFIHHLRLCKMARQAARKKNKAS